MDLVFGTYYVLNIPPLCRSREREEEVREETELSGQLLSNLDYSLKLQVLLSLFFEMLIS